ncbi:hypothetical protein MSAN_00865000 [Mycena sanguinolenta]|uniref:F-box domain-containing protein n=1 Tax=Mycena sanguinolenta TaxID=230812 RepID=A0A8H7DDE1_9AGAR|nr:hypothetical protein MSAN_00865000 [Mycena sanguinolenta]
MLFAALGDDILLNILALGDIHTVLAVSAIDKRLHDLTQAKQLWLSLIQNRMFRHALNLPPPNTDELQSLSTGELVGLVKRAVIGPQARKPTYTITFDTGLGHLQDSHLLRDPLLRDPHLLPGARYIVSGTLAKEDLCMFDVWSGRLVWSFAKKNHHVYWAVDLVPGGGTARVVVALLTDFLENGCSIHVEEIDLTTSASREVFDLGHPTRLSSILAIVGDFFLYSLISSPVRRDALVLVNWRASTYVALNYGTQTSSDVALIPGYIIATHSDSASPRRRLLTVTSFDAFAPHWKPLEAGIDFSDQLFPNTIPVTTRTRQEYHGLPLGNSKYDYVRLCITPNAVYQGSYSIVTLLCKLPNGGSPTLAALAGALFLRRPLADFLRFVELTYSWRPPPVPGQACSLRFVSSQISTCAPSVTRIQRAVATEQKGSFTVWYYQ